MSKLLFLIADGMGDFPVPELGGKTPLEAAETPAMDAMAAHCTAGTARTVPTGMHPGSDVANMALLGFNPGKYHTGRGPIEAAAQGLALSPDDVVFRLNLVNVTETSAAGTMKDYSSGHISTEAATVLIEKLQAELGDDTWSFIPGVQYRHLLVMKNGGGTPEETLFINPPHDITDQAMDKDIAAYATSPELKRLYDAAAEILACATNETKANSIWPWGQGKALTLPSFQEKFGMQGAVISAVDLVKGLGRASQMEVIDVPGATGLLDTNYEGKVQACLDFLDRGGDFVYLHVEAPDECGHAGDCEEKTEAMHRFDQRIVKPLREALGDEVAYLIACDHFTPVAEKTHTPDPVPFLLHHPACREHSLAHFSEAKAEATGLAVDPGHGLMQFVLQSIGRTI
jgi:2,3-bisphosphoglycerate-independent phosphoglycerate mutase